MRRESVLLIDSFFGIEVCLELSGLVGKVNDLIPSGIFVGEVLDRYRAGEEFVADFTDSGAEVGKGVPNVLTGSRTGRGDANALAGGLGLDIRDWIVGDPSQDQYPGP